MAIALFCRIWVGLLALSHGRDAPREEPYQTAAARFPDRFPCEDFQRAVQFIEPRGKRSSGAEAVFRLLALVPGFAWLLTLYLRLPGFAPVTEALYRLIAAHRNAAYRVTRLLWGGTVEPSTWNTASGWFARVIALIYTIAFASFGRQVRGLIGAQGVQPVTEFLVEAQKSVQLGGVLEGAWLFLVRATPISASSCIVWGGAVVSAVAGIARPHSPGQKAAFVLMFVYYLSVVQGGQVFMGFQWDYLLLEAGFLAIFLKPFWIRTWLFRWLLFRLMFESGAVKLLSGDPTWHGLTALRYHFETQPLPTPLAWYMNQAPPVLLTALTFTTLEIELVLPFLSSVRGVLSTSPVSDFIGLQISILLTGNYTFFNLLTLALCLFLFDDAFFNRFRSKKSLATPRKPATGRHGREIRSRCA